MWLHNNEEATEKQYFLYCKVSNKTEDKTEVLHLDIFSLQKGLKKGTFFDPVI